MADVTCDPPATYRERLSPLREGRATVKPIRIAVVLLVVAAVAAGALTVGLLRGGDAPAGHGNIVRVEYRQQKAVPGFDQGLHVVTDRERLRDLAAILDGAGWRPGDENWIDEGCAGGTRTEMRVGYADGAELPYDGYACSSAAPDTVRRVDDLLATWR